MASKFRGHTLLRNQLLIRAYSGALLVLLFMSFSVANGDVKSTGGEGILFGPMNGASHSIMTNSGRLGLGTFSPSANLHVTGNSIFGSNIMFTGLVKPLRSIILEAGSAMATGNAQQQFNVGNNHSYTTVLFPASSAGNAYWHWVQQKSFESGSNINVSLYWSSTSASTTANWTVSTSGVGVGESIDGAYEGSQSMASTSLASANTMSRAVFSAFNPGWNRGDYIIFSARRASSDTGTAHLHFIKIDYSVDELSD